MHIVVQKYGGSSVATPQHIMNVAKRVVKLKEQSENVVVVVSAMGKTTNELIALAHKITPNPDYREMDMLLACGENISISLLSMAIHSLGEKAISLTGHQVGIMTDTIHTGAKIMHINTDRIIQHLKEGKIVIVAGFQGVTNENEITTLGRGGSDTSAVALAAALKAAVCEILTDVDGIYTTDPNLVRSAKKIKMMSYDEVLEMAFMGAKVLHTRIVEIARRYKIPIHVRSSFDMVEGTIMKEDSDMEKVIVRGIAHNENIIKVSIVGVPDQPGIASKTFKTMGEKNLQITLISQAQSHNNLNDITFTVATTNMELVKDTVDKLAKEINAQSVVYRDDIATLSVIGEGISTSPQIPGKIFEILAENNINIDVISSSPLTISCIIDKDQIKTAVSALHQELIENEVEF